MKKKFIKMVVCIYSVIYSLSAVVTSYADNPIRVFLDGNEIQFDVLPQIIDDYTMGPVRAIFENLGYSVNWDQELQTVFATNTTTSNRSIVLDTKRIFLVLILIMILMMYSSLEETPKSLFTRMRRNLTMIW